MNGQLMVSGTHSGVGKTTITMGLIAALRRRGVAIQPFKAGPDYIDPTYHTLATGRPCRNIDTWMVPPERALYLFHKATQAANLALIEGVMGIFDGFSYTDEEGSNAQIAKLVNAPVLLVLDVGRMARSAGALALGYSRFDPAVRLAGFVLNRCGSISHYQGVKQAVEQATALPVVGWLPKTVDLHIPERHLGLVPTNERGELTAFINRAADLITEYFDLDRIITLAQAAQPPELSVETIPPVPQQPKSAVSKPSGAKTRIAVARDAAFSFYYEDNLDLLREAGAEIAFFSPLVDSSLPPGISGIYVGGGFPEIYAAPLSANTHLLESLRQAHRAGMPIYAECGGFMYLTEAITDLTGTRHTMVGVVPGKVQMAPKLVSLGYRLVESPTGNFLLPPGVTTRGHEFHWSTWSEAGQAQPAAWHICPRRKEQAHRPDGYAADNLIASYVHLHFAHDLRLAENFVQACAGWG